MHSGRPIQVANSRTRVKNKQGAKKIQLHSFFFVCMLWVRGWEWGGVTKLHTISK